jgi:branched-chain amino acid transport system substrate-binding protein
MLHDLTLRPAPRRAGRSPRAAALLALALLAGCRGGSTGDDVVLGFAAPLKDAYGRNALDGAQLAVKELNAAGGRIRLVVKDDEGDTERAIAVAQELADDPAVVAVVGHNNSAPTIAAAPLYSAAGLAAVAISATAPAISELGPWIFRVASSDSANAVELARVAAARGKKVAVMFANDEYGQELTESFTAALRASGHSVVETDPYLEETEDFRPYLERLRRRGVDLIFLAGSEQGATTLVPQARALGLDARFLGGDGVEGLAARGGVYEGMMIGVLFHPQASAEARRFAEAFRAAYGREPDSSAALAYDAVRLLARAAQDGGADRVRIRETLERVGVEGGTPAFEGVAGAIRFDARGDPVGKRFVVGVARGGRVELEVAAR